MNYLCLYCMCSLELIKSRHSTWQPQGCWQGLKTKFSFNVILLFGSRISVPGCLFSIETKINRRCPQLIGSENEYLPCFSLPFFCALAHSKRGNCANPCNDSKYINHDEMLACIESSAGTLYGGKLCYIL